MGMGRVTKTVAKMEKIIGPSKPIFIGVAGVALVMLLLSFSPSTSFPNMFDVSKMTILREKDGAATKDCTTASDQGLNLGHDPADQTFYDDPTLSYEIGNPGKNWDEKRREWLKHHPSFATGVEDRAFQEQGGLLPDPRIRYLLQQCVYAPENDQLVDQNSRLRPTMLAHPEAEWIFWVDSDAVITDMDFKLPLEKYKEHNFVVPGGSDMVYEKKSWGGLNAGMEALSDKKHSDSDDQSALVYLLLTKKEKWGIKDRERGDRVERRHAEKVSEHYATLMRDAVANQGSDGGGRKRPFITHFTACRHCSGLHWGYTAEQCYGGMEKALNFADNQVLRNYGFVRLDLMNTSSLHPLPFGFSSYNKEK
ncbi:hypothetical protein C3L33_18505, partial [Rhododendron williamsianum]